MRIPSLGRIISTSTIVLALLLGRSALGQSAAESLEQARADQRDTAHAQAVRLANEAVMKEPNSAAPLLVRADIHADVRDYAQAIADCDRALEIANTLAHAYYVRGRYRFCAGDVAGSVEDFQRFGELQPDSRQRLWENGLSLYYAGKFREGAEQFALYQTYHDNDVENSVWRYACMARDAGVQPARREMLPIRNDPRVPMMQIYALFRGEAQPENVLQAAQADDPAAEELRHRLFYAHLYLGLYYEAHGQPQASEKHMRTAIDRYKIGHYMWDVANVHCQLLDKQKPGEVKP